MAAFGSGSSQLIAAQEAVTIAKNSNPRPIPEDSLKDSLLGSLVSVAPGDYAMTATTGTLVGSSASRWIIGRTLPELGTVHVHFPKRGYSLTVHELNHEVSSSNTVIIRNWEKDLALEKCD